MIIEQKKRDVALVVDDSPETLRLLTDALDVAGRYLLAVNKRGKIMWATPQAQKLLSDTVAADADDDFVLPDPMPQWLDQAQKGKAGSKAPVMPVFPGNDQLRLQYMGKLGSNEFL